jgi:hypothetical protein
VQQRNNFAVKNKWRLLYSSIFCKKFGNKARLSSGSLSALKKGRRTARNAEQQPQEKLANVSPIII